MRFGRAPYHRPRALTRGRSGHRAAGASAWGPYISRMGSHAAVESLDTHAQTGRLRAGSGLFSRGLVGAIAMPRIGVSGPVGFLLLPVFLAGSYGVTAGLLKTCAFSAVFGKRRTES